VPERPALFTSVLPSKNDNFRKGGGLGVGKGVVARPLPGGVQRRKRNGNSENGK